MKRTFSRISSLAVLLLVAGCGSRSTVAEQVAEAPDENRVDCAIGDAPVTRDCAIERSGTLVTVRHADGSFRRFEIDAKGRFGAADGADEVSGKRGADGNVDVSIGDRRYRFTSAQLKP
jgi:hypothetical protein